ncbi:MAG: tetratricopeptide repeat protein [Caldilineaceae bacterium]|nr:tetratricopeptide repeat protein [Caldilineaceae bacterium]
MKPLDILEAHWQTESDPRKRILLLNEYVWQLSKLDSTRAALHLDEVAALLDRIAADSSFASTVLVGHEINCARIAVYQGRFEEALRLTEKILVAPVADSDTLVRCKALEIAAIAQIRLGNPSDALAALMAALDIATLLDDKERTANIYNLFAILYVNLGEHKEGAAYFEKSAALARTVDDLAHEAQVLVNLCMSYRDLGNYEKSLQCGLAGLALAQQLEAPSIELWAQNNLANTYFILGDLDKAFAYFQQAVWLAETAEDKAVQASAMLGMVRAYLQEQNYAAAKRYAHLILEIGRTNQQPGIQFEAHELLAQINKAEGKWETALHHYEAFHQIKEGIFNKEADEKLKQLEVAHRTETARRDAEIYQLRYVELQHEIVERERAQKALVQAQKLESLGILAGGVAHDFNNLLMGIVGQIELALYKMDGQDPLRQNLLQATYAAEKAAALAQKMLAYSGRGHFQLARCRLDTFFADNRALWQSLIGATCQIKLTACTTLCFVEVDKLQIEQLMINLLLNAAEAHAKSVAIQMACRTLGAADSGFWQYTAQPLSAGTYLVITVQDDGVGMDAKALERLFDPFYTTKFVGRGLGMAASLGIIRGHRGGITVRSAPNAGTTFDIVLPVIAIDLLSATASESSHQPAQSTLFPPSLYAS